MKRTTEGITRREIIGLWLNNQGLLGEAVEVGCAYGGYANEILSTWQGRWLYMVDPFTRYDEYREITNVTAPFDNWFLQCSALARGSGRAEVVRDFSVNAAKTFHDNCLDFVYIDGNHSYEAVKGDMNSWWPKVKEGGLIGGHDYRNLTTSENPDWDCEVQRAVEEFVTCRGLPYPHLTTCESFWLIKT